MEEIERYQRLRELIARSGKKLIYSGTLLKRAAELWPEKIAVITPEKSALHKNLIKLSSKEIDSGFCLTCQELFKASLLVSRELKKRGLKPGDRVVLLYENSIDYYIAYFAIWQIGLVVVPVNHFLNPHQLKYIFKNSNPDGIVISSKLLEKNKEVVKKIAVVFGQEDIYKALAVKVVSKVIPKKLDNILEQRKNDELSVLLYTSGTTGNPKGVMLSSNAILENAIQGIARFKILPDDRLFATLPLFHSYSQNTCIWSSTLLGITVIIAAKIDRKSIRMGLKLKPSVVFGIPQLYGLFSLMKNLEFGTVRYFVSGGDVLLDKIRMNFELLYKRKICNGYGLTETAPFISVDFDDVFKSVDVVGRPFIGIEYQIRDGQKVLSGRNKVGTLWVRGKNNMIGYYGMPEMTKKTLVDGWINTGDLALIDKSGKIVLSGREKDLIKHKGIKIYPQEVENVIMQHPKVLATAVVGKFKRDEEVPIAFIEGKKIENINNFKKELKELCVNRLAFYEVPREFIIQEALPRTATGKVDKKILKEKYLKSS